MIMDHCVSVDLSDFVPGCYCDPLHGDPCSHPDLSATLNWDDLIPDILRPPLRSQVFSFPSPDKSIAVDVVTTHLCHKPSASGRHHHLAHSCCNLSLACVSSQYAMHPIYAQHTQSCPSTWQTGTSLSIHFSTLLSHRPSPSTVLCPTSGTTHTFDENQGVDLLTDAPSHVPSQLIWSIPDSLDSDCEVDSDGTQFLYPPGASQFNSPFLWSLTLMVRFSLLPYLGLPYLTVSRPTLRFLWPLTLMVWSSLLPLLLCMIPRLSFLLSWVIPSSLWIAKSLT